MKIISTRLIKKIVLGLVIFCSLQVTSQNKSVSESTTNSVTNSVTVNNGESFSHTKNSENGVHKIHVKSKGDDFKVEFEGDITISKDDKDIIDISRGGYIEIKKSSFGRSRKIVIEATYGKLKKRYYVGWSEKEFYPDGKDWLAEILPRIIRTTTIGAESRVNRFYEKGGVNAVLNEINRLKSDYVKSAYYRLLLDKNIADKDLQKVVTSAGENISSDYYLASILSKNQKRFLSNPRSTSAYIDATKNINSDYYLVSVLSKAIKSDEINDEQLEKLIGISRNISSDYYLSSILTSILNNRELNKTNMDRIMKLSNSISSDYYKASVLKKALRKNNLSKENYETFINSMEDVSSDYYQTSLINDFLKEDLDDKSLDKLLGLINKNVNSSYYAAGLYKKLSRQNLSEKQLIRVLENASRNINSSNYLANTLVAFSKQVKGSSQRVKDAYIKCAKRIKSDTYFGRAMKAIY